MCQLKKKNNKPNTALKTKMLCTHHILWHHYLISMHWFFPFFTSCLEHKPTLRATQCIILPCNATQPYNNLSSAMSSATNEKNLGLKASKTQPNYNTEWNKFLTLKAGANSFIPPYDSPYLKMGAQTFLICAPHQSQPAPPARYSCWVSPHIHRLTASCCLCHTALHWHHLHLHAVENSPDKHCFCSFSNKA